MDNRRQGIIYIIMAAFFFALMNLFIRLSGDVPTMQKCFFRNAVAAVFAAAVLIKEGKGFRPKKGNVKYLFLRAVLGTAGLICNFYAVDRLNIADASVLNKLSPFFAIICSVFILGEYADKVEWALVITAFAGALFVVKPTFSGGSVPALIGLAGGFFAGAAYTFVRKLGQSFCTSDDSQSKAKPTKIASKMPDSRSATDIQLFAYERKTAHVPYSYGTCGGRRTVQHHCGIHKSSRKGDIRLRLHPGHICGAYGICFSGADTRYSQCCGICDNNCGCNYKMEIQQ